MKIYIFLVRVLVCVVFVLVVSGYFSEKIFVMGSGFVVKDDSLWIFFDVMVL